MKLNRAQEPDAKPIKSFRLLPAKKYKLPNGIQSYVMEGGSQPMVNLQLVLRLGKWQETQKGQAYFMGRMMGEGTSLHTNRELSEFFESHGAYWGVSTSSDWLELNVLCLTKHLSKILPMITELLVDATFPEKELEMVKQLSLQQYMVNREKNNYIASVLFKQNLFGQQHPYGYSIDEEVINQINRPILQAFYNKIPNQSSGYLFVAGQLEDAHWIELENSLGKLPFQRTQKLAPQLTTPDLEQNEIYEERADALQSSIKIGRLLFGKNHQDQISFQVLNTILGGYFGSRLMQNIREEKGLSYGIHSSVNFMKDQGLWMISSDVQKAKKDLALQEIRKELNRLCVELVPQEELDLVKNYMAGSFVKAINSPTAMVNCHKAIELYQLPIDYYEQYIPQVWAVEAEDLRNLANQFFTKELLEVVVG